MVLDGFYYEEVKKVNCCFTGHRAIPCDQTAQVYAMLQGIIRDLIQEGAMCFFTGGAIGFDTLCAKAVLELKQEYPTINLVLLLPCQSQARYWSKKEKVEYEEIKNRADDVRYISVEYTKSCMFQRNRALVDNADVCVCYLEKDTGGTAYTVRYAKSKGLRIINLAKK